MQPKMRIGMGIVFATLLLFFALEIGYRCYRYHTLQNGEFSFLWVEKPLYAYDEISGFKYLPSSGLKAHWLDSQAQSERTNRLDINLHGHRSQNTSPPKRTASELRIAIIGDSLSACIHNDISWPDILEKKLNRDKIWLRRHGAERVRILNFSRDGIGIEQFPAILESEAQLFDPDLILVNFITADIYRRFVWRKTVRLPEAKIPYEVVLNCTTLPAELSNPDCSFAGSIAATTDVFASPKNRKEIRADISAALNARIPWFSLYPEFFNHLSKGRLEEVIGRNPYQPKSQTFESREDSLVASAKALQSIQKHSTSTYFLHLPVYWELIHEAVPKLVGDLQEKVPDLKLISMLRYFPKRYDRDDVNRWTYYPDDMHFSNEGAEIYAQAVYGFLTQENRQIIGPLGSLRATR